MDTKKLQLATKIDDWVATAVNKGGGDEELLEGMHAYMDTLPDLSLCPP